MQKRLPEDLDLPLGKRMAKNNAKTEDPGPVPEKKSRKLLEITESADKLTLTWHVSHLPVIIAFVVIALFFFCFGLIMTVTISSSSVGPWLLLIFSYKIPHPSRKEQTISLKELEYFNIQNNQETYQLLFLSDNRIINCPVPKGAAPWIKTKIECFIYGKPSFY